MLPHGTESSAARFLRVVKMAAVSPSAANFSRFALDGCLVNKAAKLSVAVEMRL